MSNESLLQTENPDSIVGSFVQMTVPLKEAARRYLNDNNLCAIDWAVVQALVDCYNKHGKKTLIYCPSEPTYFIS